MGWAVDTASVSSSSTTPRTPKPGAKRARHQRWRRISTWVTILALAVFVVATVSFIGSLNEDTDAEATRDLLRRIATALSDQAGRNGALPETLAELQPTVASGEIVREDAYGYLIQYTRRDASTFELRSLGADGVADTSDDIVWPARN